MKRVILLLALASNAALAQISPLDGYKHTDLTSMDEAMRVWDSMKYHSLQRSSECFNRAHTWAYDMYKDFGIYSRKILIHFSYKYNKELSSKWGYHIAPLLSINGIDYVFDRKYMDRPVTVQEWQEYFVAHAQQKLENKRKELVADLNKNRRLIIRRERNGTGLFQSSPSALKKENREIMKELEYLQVTEDTEAKIDCGEIVHIEGNDLKPFSSWCQIQKISMYYWGYPQLRLLNYGSTNIPHKNNLVQARNNGEKYKMTRFNMDQVWTAREEAFNDVDKLWPYEYAIRH